MMFANLIFINAQHLATLGFRFNISNSAEANTWFFAMTKRTALIFTGAAEGGGDIILCRIG